MADEQILKPAGMFTDPNPLSSAPRGALREALNVVIRRDGTLEPRPGFQLKEMQDGQAMSGTPQRMIPWANDIVYITSSGTWVVDPYTDAVITPGSAAITGLDYGTLGSGRAMRGVTTRNNFYITAKNGLRKITSRTATAASKVGVNGRRQTLSLSLQGASGWFTTGNFVAYRLCIQRRDSNEVVVTSSPTGRYVLENAAAGDRTVQIIVGLADTGENEDLSSGDDIILYRSEISPRYPDDELFEALRYTVTSADIAATTITLQDTLAEANLGDALYTNASVEGIRLANSPPPRLQDIALFKGSIFGADVDGPRQLIIKFNAITNSTRTGVATGIGYRQYLGDTTITSPTITAVTTTVGVEVGQMISMAGIPNGALVISFVPATSITVNVNATATAAGVAGIAYDTIEFQGDTTVAVDTPVNLVSRINRGGTLSTSGVPSAYYRASLLSDFNGASSGTEQYSEVLIEEKEPNTGSVFAVQATKNTEYRPVLGAISGSTATVDDAYVDANDIPNGLVYSKNGQPEAWPDSASGYLLRVGSASHRIDRILATRDALWIFKRDGIFRLTGAGAESGWRVDPFDMTHFLIAADSAVVMDDAIYAWTNRGVVRIGDAGITQISALAIGNLLSAQERSYMNAPINAYASTTINTGWGVANLKDNEYWLSVTETSEAETQYIYVYNTKTLAWTRWLMSRQVLHGVIDGYGLGCFQVDLTSTIGPAIDYERIAPTDPSTSDVSVYADRSWTGKAATVAANADGVTWRVTLSAAIAYHTPKIGDYITGNGLTARIVALVSTSVFDVGDSLMGATSVDIYEAYPCEVEFVAKIGGSASNAKLWSGGAVMFGSTRNMSEFDVAFTSSVSTTEASVSVDVDGWLSAEVDRAWSSRFWVPRAHTRSSVLFPRVEWNQARAHPVIYGIAMANAEQAPRARR